MVTYADNEIDTSLKVYLQEIGQTALLTPLEEIKLARRIKRGDERARSHMIKANLRLVVKIAQDYANMGLPLLDLISEGNIGLMKAVERFNPSKGAKLSTYAAWWIKQSIRRALANQGKTIRLPVHMVDRISKMHRASFELTETLGREPTDDELAQRLGQTRAQIAQLRRISVRPASLDAPIGDDETEFGEIVMDEGAATAYQILHHKTLHEDMRLLLKDLDAREAEILTLRFGLNGRTPETLEEVGRRFKVTRERIRQLQNIALTKLRRSMEKRDLPVDHNEN
jgi:RNA polymerase primary sigma factor